MLQTHGTVQAKKFCIAHDNFISTTIFFDDEDKEFEGFHVSKNKEIFLDLSFCKENIMGM